MTKYLNISTDSTLGGNSPSDEVVSSQKALKTYIDNHSGGGSVAIDNSTITKNLSDEIQAVATVNANTAAGATNPLYDWVGTLAEYTTQNIESTHPDWLCFITDDTTANAYEAYSKSQTDVLLAGKVSTNSSWGLPDYHNVVTLAASDFPYTAQQPGIVYIGGTAINSWFRITVDSVEMVAVQSGNSFYSRSGQVIVDTGDIVNYSATAFLYAHFVPFKR